MKVHVRVPATSANLGPGFDSLGLALGLYNEVTASEADGVRVAIEGEGAGRFATSDKNVVARGVRLAYEAAGRPFKGCALRCVNRIPGARGLGSSAAAWVSGLVAGNTLLGTPLPPPALLTLAARAEGHPDNVAAALLGGLTVSCASADGATAVALPALPALHWVVLIPDVTSATADARAVLPPTIRREDAVFNVQRVALLLGALHANRPDVLSVALDDRLHQPYRARLFPWMTEVVAAARAAGALGCVLSGAGPSILAVATDGAPAVASAMERALHAARVGGTARELPLDTTGAISRTETS